MGDSCRFTAFPFPCGKAASDSLALMYQILCRFRRATQHAVSSKTFVWGVVGIVLVADGVYYTMAWFQARCGRLQSSAAQLTSAGDKPFNEERDAPSVRQYWVELSDAILKAPRTPLKDGERRIALPVAAEDIADGVLPDAVRIIWEDQVRYLLDRREVLLLLRSVVRGPSMTTKDDIISAASLALLWRLQLIRSVYEAVVIDGDVSQCSDDLTDLDEYSTVFYRELVCPLELFFPASSSAGIAACWFSLSEELRHLRRRRRFLQLQNTWSLVKYMYVGGWKKLVSCAMMSLLTAVAAHSTITGLAVREHIEQLLSVTPRLFLRYSRGGCIDTSSYANMRAVLGLLAFEWARLVATAAVMRVTEDYIHTSASCHRDSVKRRLYEALAQTPLAFFDLRDPDAVERLIYYVNDLEGVDVQLNDFFARLVRAAAALAAAAATLDRRSSVVVVVTVAVSNLLTGVLRILRRKCAVDLEYGNVDAEEEENGNMATDGMMLRGMEIIEHIHELRPYGADMTLMGWWTEQMSQGHKGPGTVRRIVRVVLSLCRLWTIDALASLMKWLLPAIVTAQAAARSQAQGLLMEAMRAVQELLDEALDARRVIEVVVNNAYKANALERILDPRNWEKEEVLEDGVGAATRDMNGGDNRESLCDEEARKGFLLRGGVEVEVLRIRADGLQFQYPTLPTVNAFFSPASFTLQLQDELTGAGRLICVTGPSGCGKTTLLRLLLALYKTNANSLSLQLRRRRRRTMELHSTCNGDGMPDGNHTCGDDGEVFWLPVASIPHRFLRSTLFSYMPQIATLFPGATIAQNITLRSSVSVANLSLLSRVRECAEAAACMDFIERLPQGLLTPLSSITGWATPGALRLSCGQGQRLMLARALYHGGGVLLMDEPTAGLDEASRRAVMTQLRGLLQSGRLRGALCVTHDVELLQQADQIVRL
ncbi:hypothetical protein TCDM_04992 [Trypanosoma cruzi Dm28c]|uniref:ABC transporter domain-containing protein n=2 Tax=Trypanosoma cruzi TaxID=5693 RepID=V5BJQ8_TRYCR|nr:hypothetical protein TCDM_04992 [Trypanosoma cruzi Dm28c]PBJ69733.1 hypothetical protein BCY84_19433 [Trypanosoma cruzi cruzi]PWU91838.1 hypothetical protein C4B63_41g238 [Trypanosoma cruzi]